MKLEVFFDYVCPFCLAGHEQLLEILPDYPELIVEWRPCEAHPRPDRYGLHSDLCARSMYIAKEHHIDLFQYHQTMYQAIHKGHKNIEDPNIIAEISQELLDCKIILDALSIGKYQEELTQNNHLAWNYYDFFAVPSLVLNGQVLKSIENVGLTKEAIQNFLKTNL